MKPNQTIDSASTDPGCPTGPASAARGDQPLNRLLDLLVAIPMVLIVLPVLTVAVAGVHALWSRGPLFYRQQRVGRNGRLFTIIKFRTMNSESKNGRHEAPEKRIFRGGQLLRYSKIDEVPQFLNVIKGDMSVVGPRPHHEQDVTKFESRVPGYRQRNSVRPGITGLAQLREYAGSFPWDCTKSRVKADFEYIQRKSLAFDVALIAQTVWIIGRMSQRRAFAAITSLTRRQDSRDVISLPVENSKAEAQTETRRAA